MFALKTSVEELIPAIIEKKQKVLVILA